MTRRRSWTWWVRSPCATLINFTWRCIPSSYHNAVVEEYYATREPMALDASGVWRSGGGSFPFGKNMEVFL